MRRTASDVLNELEMRVARLERQSTSIDGIDLGFKKFNPTMVKLIDMLMGKLKREYPTISERKLDVLQKEMASILSTSARSDRKRESIYGAMDKISLPSWNLDSSVELILSKAIKTSM